MSRVANTHFLKGLKCPSCGSLEPFDIETKVVTEVFDSGIGELSDIDWNDDTYCHCVNCKFTGTVINFTETEVENA